MELFNQVDPTSIESIVIYNILSNAHRLNGVNIQLLNSNLDILYESPVVSGITDIGDTDSAVTISGIRIRFDGPKINDATFTTGNNSTTSIVNANFTSLGNIFNYETNTTYVTKLYNQSSIRNTPLIQPSLSNQPIIDLSDLKINFNGSTSFMYAETSTDLLDSGDDTYSYATTASYTGSTSGYLMGFSVFT